MPNKQLYHFTHSSPEITTLADLLANPNSPAFLYNKDPNGFLKIVGEDGCTNRERIEFTYTLSEDRIFIGAPFSRMIIKVGTVLYLEYEKVNEPSFLTEGVNVVSNDEPAFKAQKLAELEADKGYYQIDNPIAGQLQAGSSQESYPDVSVWIWCRALSPREDENFELSGQLINVTPFIEKITTNMTKNGGNFQIKLPPLMCELDTANNKWILKRSSIDQYQTKNDASLQGDGYVANSTLLEIEDGDFERTQMYFHNIIRSNDLVFIRFETLKMEQDQRYSDAQEYYIDKTLLANRIYDMIGLVDSNTQAVSPPNNDVSINITGRDLSKLFIEDGTYFYALENSQGMLKFAGQSSIKDPQLSRIFADNGMSFIGLYLFQSIEYILKFIFQQLSNIEIVPDDLFGSYAKSKKIENGVTVEYDSRTKVMRSNGSNGIDPKKQKQIKEDALSKVDLLRASAGKSSTPKLKEDLFNEMVHFLDKLRKDNNRQINQWQNTQGWKPFIYKGEQIEKDTLPQYFADNLLNDKGDFNADLFRFLNLCDRYIDAGTPTKSYKEKLAAGIWQIIDLVIDKTVATRRLADSSFSTANGSLLNFIRSAVQEPLCEFFMDTYGDKYHLIVRRPPYDQRALISLIEGKVNTQDGVAKTPPAIVDIEARDVLFESLAYDDSQIYSWYHFFPKNALIGDAQNYSLSYLGALYFPEYAKVWGSKPFQQSNSYIPYAPLKNNNESGLEVDELQAIEDLKYVVESSQYLPFTRKGVLTLNRDRRIKIGNVIRYKPTGEIFFVEAVQHTFSVNENTIDAVTTVQVTRGMIEQLIYGTYLVDRSGNPKFVSYFNIINTDLVFNKREVEYKVNRRVKKKSAKSQVITKDVITPASFMINNLLQGAQVIERGQNEGIGYLETYNAYPRHKNLFINFINLINAKGYWVTIGPKSANRTYAQQAALKRGNPNNAAPGHSNHERGAAIDVTCTNKRTGEVHSKKTDKDAWIATGIPALARSLGMRWAGGDGSFGTYIDRVHFEVATVTEQLSHEQMIAEEYEDVEENVKKMDIDREGIFQNFKVNKFSFNFFLKNMQSGKDFRKVTSRNIYSNSGIVLEDVKLQSLKKKGVRK